MPHPDRVKDLKAALADFRAAQADVNRVIREAPAGEAGRLELETALRRAVDAGDRMQEAARKLRH